jgi:1,4-alpha-glucan branching enzyme
MFLSWMWAHPGKKLLFQGDEIGQWREWDHSHSIDWHLLQHQPHAGLQRLVRRLNEIYRTEPALFALDDHPEGFEWVDFHDADNTVWSFIRKLSDGSGSSQLLVVVNATPVVRHGYRIGVPVSGSYEVILNSDHADFGGSGSLADGVFHSEGSGAHGKDYSIAMNLPPLAVVILRIPHF